MDSLTLYKHTLDLWEAKSPDKPWKTATYLWNLAKPCINDSPDLSADIHSILLDFLAFEACQSLGKLSLCGLVRFIALWAKMKAQTKLYIPSTMKIVSNVWCIKNRTKLSSVLLLSLVRFLMHQTLQWYLLAVHWVVTVVKYQIMV